MLWLYAIVIFWIYVEQSYSDLVYNNRFWFILCIISCITFGSFKHMLVQQFSESLHHTKALSVVITILIWRLQSSAVTKCINVNNWPTNCMRAHNASLVLPNDAKIQKSTVASLFITACLHVLITSYIKCVTNLRNWFCHMNLHTIVLFCKIQVFKFFVIAWEHAQ